MAILIYPYSNPYKISCEPYWAMVKNSFHLCGAQTLVNGLCDQYKDFYQGKLTTINRFINCLFNNWESDPTIIEQQVVVDNSILYMDFSNVVPGVSSDDISISLRRNRKYVLKSIRIMYELGMNPKNMVQEQLSTAQKCVVAIYSELLRTNNPVFSLRNNISEAEIDNAIEKTIADAMKANNASISDDKIVEATQTIGKSTIVVHGIHQFTPLMLRTIELLSQYKTVIMMFNYLDDYKNVYQTWLNIYEWFESKIMLPKQNFYDHENTFQGNILADSMAAMISGSTANVSSTQNIEVLEFDNQTEFAFYISQKFEEAEKARKENNFFHPALFYIKEQFYAANSDVNDVLRVYFPEQFNEYDFLEFPIGHFFIAVTNMWDPDSCSMRIRDLNDIRECLSCGIISEQTPGEVISIFDKCSLFFSNATTIDSIIKKAKKLKSRLDDVSEEADSLGDLKRVGYFDISATEVDTLVQALSELNEIILQFFSDFNDKKSDFKRFYNKISDVLVTKVLDKEELNSEFRDIVKRVLDRLSEIKDIEAKASFDCLKDTMQLYLVQTSKTRNGANWIVRNFEQIDGDVLRKISNDNAKVYHFACLSDQDMSVTHRDEFPWPLDVAFFEIAQAPVDWKYQVYVTSRLEYKNFRRYALVYGLAFSKCPIKLSYIKNKNDNKYDLYYMLKVLGAKITPFSFDEADGYKEKGDFIVLEKSDYKQFDQYDLMKYRLCPYRFLLESAIEGNTNYKDDFLLRQYMTIILEHRARKHFSGKAYIRSMVYSFLVSEMEDLASDFPFINALDISDSVNTAIKYLEKHAVFRNKFVSLGAAEYDYMRKREEFLHVPNKKYSSEQMQTVFKNASQQEVDSILNEANLAKASYIRSTSSLCEKCAEKDICLELYKTKRG